MQLVNIENAFFKVNQVELYILDDYENKNYQVLERHYAVIDTERNRVFATVTDDYLLVTNEEAVYRSHKLFEHFFPFAKANDIVCINMIMPKTRSYCYIDLTHDNETFYSRHGDHWTGFIRVTNSYNKTKKLIYEIGFCRCDNKSGFILDSKTIKVSTTHTIGAKQKIDYNLEDIENINKLKESFMESLIYLERYYISPDLMFPLIIKVFSLNFNVKNKSKKRIENMVNQHGYFLKIIDLYFHRYGHHGYSALNVLIDIASQPNESYIRSVDVNKHQIQCGNWMESFISEIENREFDMRKFLENQIIEAYEFEKNLKV